LGKDGESSDKDESKTTDSKTSTDESKPKDDKKKKKTLVPDAESLKDTIIPADLYTCRAEPEIPYEQNPDYVKCFSCESDSKSSALKCKQTPRNDSSSSVWCNTKQQNCFSKAVYNMARNSELLSFSRGCAALSDLDPNAAGDAATSPSEARAQVTCVKKSNSTQACYETCDRNFCNSISELKSSAAAVASGTSMLFIVFVFIASQLSSYIDIFTY
jgi:hypothetical protein